jgi:pyridoxal phosphate enzyme (YggS family)
VSGLAVRLAAVHERIAAACQRAGRARDDVTLVAVSKKHPASAVSEAVACGVTDVGENYVQELVAKKAEVPLPVRWHFIGGLQRNKAKALIGHVALIHAVDSASLADEIAKRAAAANVVQPILLAMSAAGETQKSGAAPDQLGELLAHCAQLPALAVRGLMTMPPLDLDAEAARPYFRALRQQRDRLATDSHPLAVLSMGMSHDFEVAIEEGATLIRVGTAIFGPRQ